MSSKANTVIQAAGLGKSFSITHTDTPRYLSLRDEIAKQVKSWGRNLFSKSDTNETRELFWALRDINFSVQQGDRIGILGRNGAGKSTLLKILSRITNPTEGEVRIKGRLASLLEVGTGFHPELTGRENIFLNGAILGMNRKEIQARFDEIVAFAEIERFLDTQVKRYSSGMYMRLAFSVAAHLDPEILVIDEVLAVGDSVFQKKCIDRMTDVSRSGRTLLFVSHNLQAVRTLCTRGIVLDKGRVMADTDITSALNAYTSQFQLSGSKIDLLQVPRKKYSHELIFSEVSFAESPIPFGKPIKISVKLKSQNPATKISDIDMALSISDKDGNYVMHVCNRFVNKHFDHSSDQVEYVFEIENFLKPNIYYITLFLRAKDTIQDWLMDILSFEIGDGNPYGFYDSYQIQGATLPKFTIDCAKTGS